MRQKYGKYVLFAGLVVIYLILAYKNPFSNRSLIPNLEPYPDSLYYSYPAWSFVRGTGFGMNINGDSIPTIVPPGYSWWLLPFMFVFKDVRSFYLGNIVLQLGTILLVGATLQKLFGRTANKPAIFLGGWILVTNYYFYTLPSLLMAENITIFMMAAGLYILTQPVTIGKSILAGLIGVFFWLIKLSNAPLGTSFLLLYSLKVLKEKGWNFFLRYAGYAVLLCLGYYLGYYAPQTSSNPANVGQMIAFSANYFWDNFQFDIRAITGGETRYLWFGARYISPLWVGLGIVGVVTLLTQKRFYWLAIMVLTFSASLIVFMSFFYYPDTRYIFSLLPILACVMVLPISLLRKRVSQVIVVILVTLQLIVPQFNESAVEPKIISLKKQVGINFKHREDPWNYNAIVHVNEFMKDKAGVYMGTFLPPFYVEMFKQGNYYYLPISPAQEFSGPTRPLIDRLYQSDGSITKLYERLLGEGKQIYITNAYVSNVSQWSDDLEEIKNKFNAELVSEGCLGSCDIYELENE